MALPMMGSRPGTLTNIGASSIHGQLNVQLQFQLDGDPALHVGTVASESCATGLQPGDRIQLEFVLGNVMKCSRL